MAIALSIASQCHRVRRMINTHQRGISLYQGLYALTLGTIIFLCTAPVCYRLLADRHVVAYTNELVGNLQQARRVAINAMSPVTLCSSNNARDCTQTPWSQGYISFYDMGQPGVVDGNDRVIRAFQPPRITSIRVVLNGGQHIRFQHNGGVVADASREQNIKYSPQRSVLTRLLGAFSPIPSAYAVELDAPAPSVAFLVCGGQVGRAIRVTAIGRLDTTTVACH